MHLYIVGVEAFETRSDVFQLASQMLNIIRKDNCEQCVHM